MASKDDRFFIDGHAIVQANLRLQQSITLGRRTTSATEPALVALQRPVTQDSRCHRFQFHIVHTGRDGDIRHGWILQLIQTALDHELTVCCVGPRADETSRPQRPVQPARRADRIAGATHNSSRTGQVPSGLGKYEPTACQRSGWYSVSRSIAHRGAYQTPSECQASVVLPAYSGELLLSSPRSHR